MNAEIAQVQEEVAIEKKIREENENRLVKLLESICSRVHDEVQAERRSRQAAEEKFMKVLEDTCNHLEARSNAVVPMPQRSHYRSVSPASGSISMSYSGSMM